MPSARTRFVPCLAALALLLASSSAAASPLTGSYEFGLAGVNSLWMGDSESSLGDEDGFCANFGASFDIVVACHYELSVDGRGRIGGFAEFAGFTHGRYVELEGPIKGAQRGDNRSGITKAAFQVRLLGATVQGNELFRTRVIFKFAGQLDAAGQLSGLWMQRFCVEGAGCTTNRTPAAPSTWTNGHWTLSLNIGEEGIEDFSLPPNFGFYPTGIRTLSGSARIRFGDDSVCDFSVSGREDVLTAFADLELKPISTKCKGGSLRMRSLTRIVGRSDDTIVGELQYSLFGVRGVTVVDSTTPSLYRILLEHVRDPVGQPLPPFGVPGSGSSGAGSASSGAVMVVTVIDWPPPQPAPAQGASLSVSAIEVNAAALDLSAMERSALLQPSPFIQSQSSSVTLMIQPGFDPNTQY